jgi:hypothetical protein
MHFGLAASAAARGWRCGSTAAASADRRPERPGIGPVSTEYPSWTFRPSRRVRRIWSIDCTVIVVVGPRRIAGATEPTDNNDKLSKLPNIAMNLRARCEIC